MVLRPDEEANASVMERDKRFNANVGSAAKTVGSLAATAATAAYGGPLAARLAPFFSKYIPVDFALKGISKVSPKIGDFLKRGMNVGLPIEEGLKYVQEKFLGGQETERNEPKDDRNIIQQYDPELYSYLEQSVKKGIPLAQAGEKAFGHDRFSRIIKDLVKDHKTSWSSILQTVFGGSQGQQQQQQQADSGGNGNQRLMDMLSKLQQARGQQ